MCAVDTVNFVVQYRREQSATMCTPTLHIPFLTLIHHLCGCYFEHWCKVNSATTRRKRRCHIRNDGRIVYMDLWCMSLLRINLLRVNLLRMNLLRMNLLRVNLLRINLLCISLLRINYSKWNSWSCWNRLGNTLARPKVVDAFVAICVRSVVVAVDSSTLVSGTVSAIGIGCFATTSATLANATGTDWLRTIDKREHCSVG